MMRKLAIAGLVLTSMFAVTSESFAGVTGKSFKIDVDDGNKAAVAFNANGTDLIVHVDGDDTPGTYIEIPPGSILGSFVFGFTNTEDYIGFFFANCQDPLLAPATLTGFGYGSSGGYTFKGAEK